MAKTKIETKKVYTLIKLFTPISAQKLTAFQGTVPPHNSLETSRNICDVLRNLAPFIEFKNREKHPWRSDTFSIVKFQGSATLLKVSLLHGCFSRFLNCTNGT